MSTEHKEKDLIDQSNKCLTKLDSVPLHARQKITVINRYVTSKIRWLLTIYSFSETWIKCSCNADIKRLYNATSYKYVKHDEIVNACAGKENFDLLSLREEKMRKSGQTF